MLKTYHEQSGAKGDKNMNKQLINVIRQGVDLHVHIGPEIIPRKYTVEKLLRSEKGKIAGMVLKNHFYPTSPLVPRTSDKPCLFGSIVLNNFVGGLNPEAIYAASLVGPKPLLVWFPTVSSKRFLDKSTYEIAPEWVNQKKFRGRYSHEIEGIRIANNRGRIFENAIRVLKVIKTTNSILATGHISPNESLILVNAARKIGITKVIVTHPIYQKIDMPVSMQKQLIRYGAIIEQSFSMYSIDKIAIKKIVDQIKEVGANNIVLSSDVGQTFSPSPSRALYEFGEKLTQYKITMEELKTMIVINPRQLVGLT